LKKNLNEILCKLKWRRFWKNSNNFYHFNKLKRWALRDPKSNRWSGCSRFFVWSRLNDLSQRYFKRIVTYLSFRFTSIDENFQSFLLTTTLLTLAKSTVYTLNKPRATEQLLTPDKQNTIKCVICNDNGGLNLTYQLSFTIHLNFRLQPDEYWFTRPVPKHGFLTRSGELN
jgi:hypothetical protein